MSLIRASLCEIERGRLPYPAIKCHPIPGKFRLKELHLDAPGHTLYWASVLVCAGASNSVRHVDSVTGGHSATGIVRIATPCSWEKHRAVIFIGDLFGIHVRYAARSMGKEGNGAAGRREGWSQKGTGGVQNVQKKESTCR